MTDDTIEDKRLHALGVKALSSGDYREVAELYSNAIWRGDYESAQKIMDAAATKAAAPFKQDRSVARLFGKAFVRGDALGSEEFDELFRTSLEGKIILPDYETLSGQARDTCEAILEALARHEIKKPRRRTGA